MKCNHQWCFIAWYNTNKGERDHIFICPKCNTKKIITEEDLKESEK